MHVKMVLFLRDDNMECCGMDVCVHFYCSRMQEEHIESLTCRLQCADREKKLIGTTFLDVS